MEPWRARLDAGDSDAAWNLFIDRYRRLILATIRRTLADEQDLVDVFADVCGALSANGLERLKRHSASTQTSRFSTWLVAVVHNHTIDWLRRRDGRPRATPPSGLSSLQQEIFEHVFARRRTHAEAYELVRARRKLTFGAFLKEVAETYRVVQRARGRGWLHYFAGPRAGSEGSAPRADEGYASLEMAERLEDALGSLPADERLAVQLFAVDEIPAAEVARLVGWPNAKTVYNRVYRALDRLRDHLEGMGIARSDL